jgi:hypothetical protein
MKEYSVGPDEIYMNENSPLKNAEWIVYWYESGSYDGDGIGVAKYKDGYEILNLGHCSCYGPVEHINGVPDFKTTKELLDAREFSADNEKDYDYARVKAVREKVIELTKRKNKKKEITYEI